MEVCNCNLSFLQLLHFFTCVCIQLFSSVSFSDENRGTNKEHRATNQPEIFSPLGGNCHKYLKCLSKCMEITQCHEHMFLSGTRGSKRGREEVEDDSRSNRPSTSRTEVSVERVKQTVRGDLQLTVRMIASLLDMKKDSIWKIITKDLGMWKVRKNGAKGAK